MHRAIGDNLTCIFVDHGLLRKNEGDDVERIFSKKFNMNLIRVNAEDRFLGKLKGVSEPEAKRKHTTSRWGIAEWTTGNPDHASR